MDEQDRIQLLEDAVLDLLGSSSPEEIRRETRLPEARCEELYDLFNDISRKRGSK